MKHAQPLAVAHRRKACAGARFAVMAVLLAFAHELPVSAGQLTYPALGNINSRQGTIEMWLTPRFDHEQPIRGGFQGRNILTIRHDGENYLTLLWRIRVTERLGQQGGPYVTGRMGGQRFTDFSSLMYRVDTHAWKQGQARHIAYCWDGTENWWIIDGEPVNRTRMDKRIDFRVDEDLQIVLGDGRDNPFVIRDLRISSIPRRPDEVGYHRPEGLAKDPFTLLLDPLNESFPCDGQQQTQPLIMMPSPTQTGGLPDEDCQFVEAGRGISL